MGRERVRISKPRGTLLRSTMFTKATAFILGAGVNRLALSQLLKPTDCLNHNGRLGPGRHDLCGFPLEDARLEMGNPPVGILGVAVVI